MSNFLIAALYKFVSFDALEPLQAELKAAASVHRIKGTLLIAHEGINGTIAGTPDDLRAMLDVIRALPGCADIEHKESWADEMPFLRMRVRLKKEIVTLGRPEADPSKIVGNYVEPAAWNDLIQGEDVVVIDTRNDYEVDIGTFKGAVDPQTASFGEFPDWWARHHNAFAGKKVAMFCTGGIRCEKSTAFLKSQGVEDVFHLKGGILKYLEEVPQDQSLWDGQCFVFDQRVSVGHGLEPGDYALCYACRRPILPEDRNRPEFEVGVSCHLCVDEISDAQRQSFRERQKQVELARARGGQHIGQADETQIHKSKLQG